MGKKYAKHTHHSQTNLMLWGMLAGVALFAANNQKLFVAPAAPPSSIAPSLAATSELQAMVDARVKSAIQQGGWVARISSLEVTVADLKSALKSSAVVISSTRGAVSKPVLRRVQSTPTAATAATTAPESAPESVAQTLENLVDLKLVIQRILRDNPSWQRADVEKAVNKLKVEKWVQPTWRGSTEKWYVSRARSLSRKLFGI
jgi:hypothetical protein